MPVVLRHGPYALYFYSIDREEPPHVHVRRDAARAKYWLDPVWHARSHGFNDVELRKIERLIHERQTELLEKWHEYFSD